MSNRYASIVNQVVGDIAVQIEKYLEAVPAVDWSCKDGQLIAKIDGEEQVFTFERDDPITEALLLLLNNKGLILSRLRNPA